MSGLSLEGVTSTPMQSFQDDTDKRILLISKAGGDANVLLLIHVSSTQEWKLTHRPNILHAKVQLVGVSSSNAKAMLVPLQLMCYIDLLEEVWRRMVIWEEKVRVS